jgi:hypothetical protein
MMERLTICEEICKLVHVKRLNMRRTLLSKREMLAIWRELIANKTEIEQLRAQLRAKTDK